MSSAMSFDFLKWSTGEMKNKRDLSSSGEREREREMGSQGSVES